uniref:Uncharacterized protein n=1 Tax=Coccolithus braarudii TaxID=221442 RepID=A0A7S0LI49_9EUKA|mmetsp:Transcript_38583/g.82213  ORF Transcript_38583/g.82213 Transcript_38583/m.82213 type:complete len:174 (+) Transcript_38583:1-522(+)
MGVIKRYSLSGHRPAYWDVTYQVPKAVEAGNLPVGAKSEKPKNEFDTRHYKRNKIEWKGQDDSVRLDYSYGTNKLVNYDLIEKNSVVSPHIPQPEWWYKQQAIVDHFEELDLPVPPGQPTKVSTFHISKQGFAMKHVIDPDILTDPNGGLWREPAKETAKDTEAAPAAKKSDS